MKKPASFRHYVLASICIIIFLFGACELIFQFTPLKKIITAPQPVGLKEEYSPELNYINSVAKLEAHTDSLFSVTPRGRISSRGLYPIILNQVVRKRFYHGLYKYSIGNNFMALLATKISGRSWNEVWDADDILKSPHAFCGQQSLVEMNLLIKKGYAVRSILMQAPTFKQGHFAFEVFFDNNWHFFDPDMEPKAELLTERGRPSLAELNSSILSDRSILANLYPHANPDVMFELFNNYKQGEVNKLMPDRVYLFASITKFVSYISCLLSIVLYFLFLRRVRFSFSESWILKRFRTDERQPVPVL